LPRTVLNMRSLPQPRTFIRSHRPDWPNKNSVFARPFAPLRRAAGRTWRATKWRTLCIDGGRRRQAGGETTTVCRGTLSPRQPRVRTIAPGSRALRRPRTADYRTHGSSNECEHERSQVASGLRPLLHLQFDTRAVTVKLGCVHALDLRDARLILSAMHDPRGILKHIGSLGQVIDEEMAGGVAR
jgi:hypothetical protein